MQPKEPLNSNSLAEQIAGVAKNGIGIVPLTGAGISYAAGIPLVSQLPRHLALCIGMAFGLDGEDEANGVFWHPRFGPWPPMQGNWTHRAELCRERISQLVRCSLAQNIPEELWQPASRFLNSLKIAHGHLDDWRLALHFLARLRPPRATQWTLPPKNGERTVDKRALETQTSNPIDPALVQRICFILEQCKPLIEPADVDQHIIDSYFNFLTAGRTPTMAHRILVHFRIALRTNVILTFNFDDLMEQAYQECGIVPSIFEVHHSSPPPAPSLLGTGPAIIKLHGGQWGLRADVTLDQDPSDRERRHFRGYFLGEDWPNQRADEKQLPPRRARHHLLIAGVSGSDGRVCSLVEDVIKNFDNDFRVYWCCYTITDVHQVEYFLKQSQLTKEERSRVLIAKINHIGLTLWEIYHGVMQCPVPSGLEFPANWQLPIAPDILKHEETAIKEAHANITEEANTWFNNDPSSPWLAIHHKDSASQYESADQGRAYWGITSLGWQLFNEWNAKANCLWIDFEDLENSGDFAAMFIEAVESRLGLSHRAPALEIPRQPSDSGMLANAEGELVSLLARSPANWILFLNMRSSFGYSANMFSRLDPKRGEQPYLNARSIPHDELVGIQNSIEKIVRSNGAANPGNTCRLRVVFLEREHNESLNSFSNPPLKLIPVERPAFREGNPAGWALNSVRRLLSDGYDNIKLTGDLQLRKRLRCLALFPQVRQISSIFSRSIDNNMSESHPHSFANALHQIRQLVALQFIRTKTGGFLHMHWDIREQLRAELRKDKDVEMARPDLHIGQADWSMTLFEATKNPLAVYQAIYHRCMAADLLRRLYDGTADNDQPQKTRFIVKARVAIAEAVNHLERARTSLYSWGSSRAGDMCFEGLQKFLSTFHTMGDDRLAEVVYVAGTKAALHRLDLLRDSGRTAEVFDNLKYAEEFLSKYSKLKSGIVNSDRFYMRSRNQIALERINIYITYRRYSISLAAIYCELSKEECGFLWRQIRTIGNDSQRIWGILYDWVQQQGSQNCRFRSIRFEQRIFVLQLLRRRLEVELLVYESRLVYGNFASLPESERQLLLTKILSIYQIARMIARFFTDGSDPGLQIALSRLHSVFSGIMSHIGEFPPTVQRHLIESSIKAVQLPESESGIAVTVTLLRRIYCRFQELLKIHALLEYYIQRLDKLRRYSAVDQASYGAADLVPPSDDNLFKAETLVKEVGTMLDEAALRLSRNRKSLWWWVSYARYRMVWYVQREMLREIYDRKFLEDPNDGQNALQLHRNRIVREHEVEAALHLLNGVIRRTVDDTFQLCRIADTCHQMILFSGLVMNPPEGSQRLMKLTARTFMDVMSRITSLEVSYSRLRIKGKRDENVTKYIEKVIESITEFLAFLK